MRSSGPIKASALSPVTSATPKPQAAPAPKAEPAPKILADSLSRGPRATTAAATSLYGPDGSFNVPLAADRLKAALGLKMAWGRLYCIRDGASGPTAAITKEVILKALGTSLLPSPTQLRDLEHYLYASLATQNGLFNATPAPGDSEPVKARKSVERVLNAAATTAATLGYSAAKWLGQNTLLDPLKGAGQTSTGPETSKASWGEVKAGLEGVWDGLKSK